MKSIDGVAPAAKMSGDGESTGGESCAVSACRAFDGTRDSGG